MAQNSARNTLKKNRARLTYLRNLILVSNVFYVILRMILRRHSYNVGQFVLWVLCNTLVAVCYYSLYEVSKPVFSKGELLDGGYDILGKGWVEYCHDIIYICCFAQFLCTLSNKFWFILLLIPAYAIFSFLRLVISPTATSTSTKATPKKRK